MGRIGATFIAVVSAAFAFGCGSSEPIASNGNGSGPASNRSASVNVNQVNDPNASVANSETPANKVLTRIEQMRAEAANKPVDQNAGKSVRSAAENSTITTQLTDYARETRVFNRHPTLLSVEKVHDGKDGQVNITMRDGRKITLKGDTVMNLETVTSEEILALVEAGDAPATERDPNKAKKP